MLRIYYRMNHATMREKPDTLPLFPILLPSVPFDELTHLPASSGVYFALDERGNVLYVGATKNLQKRWRHHNQYCQLQQGECRSIAYYSCPVEMLNETELSMIVQFQPLLNRASGHAYDRPLCLQLTKEPITITLTIEGKKIWSALAKKRGVSRSAVLEVLLRKEAEREHLIIPPPTQGDTT
jgi:hypothetical protein